MNFLIAAFTFFCLEAFHFNCETFTEAFLFTSIPNSGVMQLKVEYPGYRETGSSFFSSDAVLDVSTVPTITRGNKLVLTATNKNTDSSENVPSTQMKGMSIPDKYEWIPILKASEIAPGDIIPFTQDGQQLLLIAEDETGCIYCTAQASPFLSYPLSQGRLEGNCIMCPQSGTKFDLESGKVVDQWCPFPPLLGPFVLGKLVAPRDLAVFPTRAKKGMIEVYINRNFQSQFESQYWSGLLDAQGKATGDYY